MTLVIIIATIFMFLYTAGFAITLWKGQSKTGSISVLILALTILILPFFTVIKF